MFELGQVVQCKQRRSDWKIVRIINNGFNDIFILNSIYNEVEVPADVMDIFYTQKLKLYNSLGHMIMKDDVEFLKLLAEKLKNQPIIDGLDVNYIDRLLSIGNNDGQ